MRQSPNKTVCAAALGINRKNIYRQLKLPLTDQALKQQIEAVHRDHPAYGHRRIALHLGINPKRTQRVLAKFNLRPPRRRTIHFTTRSTTPHPYQNLLKDLPAITPPHQRWCSDLTHLV